MSRGVRQVATISYIKDTRDVSLATQVGTVIVNYLVGTKSDVSSNVCFYAADGKLVSFYKWDLYTPIAELKTSDLKITKTLFVNTEEELIAMKKLQEYLNSIPISNRSPEDVALLKSVVRTIREQEMILAKEFVQAEEEDFAVVRRFNDTGTVRNSIKSPNPPRVQESFVEVEYTEPIPVLSTKSPVSQPKSRVPTYTRIADF